MRADSPTVGYIRPLTTVTALSFQVTSEQIPKMLKFFLIAALVPALVLAQTTPVRQCGNGAPLPASVIINDCTAMPCTLVDGAPVVAFAEGITSPVATASLNSFITVRLAGLQIPFPLPPELADACVAGTPPGTCPVAAGDSFDYTLDFAGQSLGMTGVTVQIEVGLTGDGGSQVTCVLFDAFIASN